ncbi:uncharacterized protein LOC144577234 [Callithrix jacchus]
MWAAQEGLPAQASDPQTPLRPAGVCKSSRSALSGAVRAETRPAVRTAPVDGGRPPGPFSAAGTAPGLGQAGGGKPGPRGPAQANPGRGPVPIGIAGRAAAGRAGREGEGEAGARPGPDRGGAASPRRQGGAGLPGPARGAAPGCAAWPGCRPVTNTHRWKGL